MKFVTASQGGQSVAPSPLLLVQVSGPSTNRSLAPWRAC